MFILADDLGYGDLGVTGQNARAAQGLPAIATPNIDALANSGMRFTNMFTGAPICSSSRAALLTGTSVGHSIIDRVGHELEIRSGDSDRTWGQVLQSAGYATGMFGKWHLGGFNSLSIRTPGALPTQKGFETAFGSMTGGFRREWLWESDGTGSMRLVRSALDPTWPGPGPAVAYSEDELADRTTAFIRDRAAAGGRFSAYAAFTAPHSPFNEISPDHPYADMPWPQTYRNYAGMVNRLDQHVGQILDAINDPNGDGDPSDSIADQTVVIFASDNGPLWPEPWQPWQPEFFDSNGIYSEHKSSVKGGGIRTPFFVRWEGTVPAGAVNDTYASFIDVLPTFAELTGEQTPLGIDGVSFLPVITGAGDLRRPDSYVWSYPQDFGAIKADAWGLQVGDWKLIRYRPTNAFSLYNIKNDPEESVNLAAARPDIKNALEAIAFAEGMDREPSAPWSSNPDVSVQLNTYFTQYKNWTPANGSTDFFAPANWTGGTQQSAPGVPDAANWNTGPADNWIATLANSGAQPQQIALSQNAAVLALEIYGDEASLSLSVPSGVNLSSRNGFRIGSGGALQLQGGTLNTIQEVDIQNGGSLEGAGTITGQQHVIAGIPEFANQGLFEPRVVNGGRLSIENSNLTPSQAGTINIEGEYWQGAAGELQIDIFGNGEVAGVDFDQLTTTGPMHLGGTLHAEFGVPVSLSLGDSFPILVAGGGIVGAFHEVVGPDIGADLTWAVHYSPTVARLTVVEKLPTGPGYLALWKASFDVDAGGDLDGDGDTDGADFLRWQRQYSASAFMGVPEPPSILLLLAAMTAARRRRVQSRA